MRPIFRAWKKSEKEAGEERGRDRFRVGLHRHLHFQRQGKPTPSTLNSHENLWISLCVSPSLQSYVSTNLDVNSNGLADAAPTQVDLSDDDDLPGEPAPAHGKGLRGEDDGPSATSADIRSHVGVVKMEEGSREEVDPLVVPELEGATPGRPGQGGQPAGVRPKARKPLPALLKIGNSRPRDDEEMGGATCGDQVKCVTLRY